MSTFICKPASRGSLIALMVLGGFLTACPPVSTLHLRNATAADFVACYQSHQTPVPSGATVTITRNSRLSGFLIKRAGQPPLFYEIGETQIRTACRKPFLFFGSKPTLIVEPDFRIVLECRGKRAANEDDNSPIYRAPTPVDATTALDRLLYRADETGSARNEPE